MKKVYTSRNLSHVDLARTLLESSGIECHLRNEHSAHTAAGGVGFAMPFAWPEIWVKESDSEIAENIISQFQADHEEDALKE
jgi:hypothetical protein